MLGRSCNSSRVESFSLLAELALPQPSCTVTQPSSFFFWSGREPWVDFGKKECVVLQSRDLCIIFRQGKSASLHQRGEIYICGPWEFRRIWEFVFFYCIDPCTSIPCLKVLVLAQQTCQGWEPNLLQSSATFITVWPVSQLFCPSAVEESHCIKALWLSHVPFSLWFITLSTNCCRSSCQGSKVRDWFVHRKLIRMWSVLRFNLWGGGRGGGAQSKRSRIGQREEMNDDVVITKAQLTSRASLDLGWPCSVVPSWRKGARPLCPASNSHLVRAVLGKKVWPWARWLALFSLEQAPGKVSGIERRENEYLSLPGRSEQKILTSTHQPTYSHI